jgi:hypothetical protein
MCSLERKFFNIYFEKYRNNKILREFVNIEDDIKKLNDIKNKRFQQNNIYSLEQVFDILTKLLKNKNLINNFESFFKKFNRLFNTTYKSKDILSAWMIFICPEYILDITLDELNNLNSNNYKKNVYYSAEQLIYHLTYFKSVNIISFNKYIFDYQVNFNIFLNIDKLQKAFELSKEYMGIEETIYEITESKKYNENEKIIILNNLTDTQNEIKKYINLFNFTISFEKLKQNVVNKIKFKNMIKKEFKNEIEKCFDEKKYDIVKDLLTEIKQFILKFNKNKDDINNFFDIDYIIHLFNHDIITIFDINNFCLKLIDYILPYGSKALENYKRDEWNCIFNNKINNNSINKFATIFIYFILELINEIIEEILSFEIFCSKYLVK